MERPFVSFSYSPFFISYEQFDHVAQKGGTMDHPGEFEFTVDEQYENEKGVFRVIAIDGEEMVIRWQNGEEIRTEIDLQLRIADRRHREKEEREFAGKPPPKPTSTGKKIAFSGFAPTDFKKSPYGTTWRSRSQLGAAVAQKISSTGFKFNSWAFGNKPEMHVQDIEHHGHSETEYQARFFVRVDPRALYYGFRVARPNSKGGTSTDWNAFSEWLTQQENENMLHAMAVKDNLIFCNFTSPSSCPLVALDEGWCADENGRQPRKETLAVYINDAPETRPFDLQLFGMIDKNDVVAIGRDIVGNVAQLFTRLLPLYQAAVTH